MNEGLYRGKRKDNGEWVEGYYFCKRIRLEGSKEFISEKSIITPGIEEIRGAYGERSDFIEYEVIPETVGQYTGQTDSNGKKIFEGDIMRNAGNVVEFGMDSFCINGDCPLSLWTKTAIIGNIYDNPELL